MIAARPNRRWVLIISVLVLITVFYSFSFRKPHVEVSSDQTIDYNGFPIDREDLGYAWYDYLHNPPTSSVRANIPEAVTRLPITTSSIQEKTSTLVADPVVTAPPARPFEFPQITRGNATLDNNEYSRMLVVTRKKKEGLKWLEKAKENDPLLGSIVYDLEDKQGDNFITGGKSMVYFKYLVDHYDSLRDITVFTQAPWNLDRLLNSSAQSVLDYMDRVKVIESGFFNLRCKTHPGCPKGIYLNMEDEYFDRPEDVVMNQVWQEFFGDQTPPKILSQPHYGQFALSRDRIRAIPKEQYQYFLDRLVASSLAKDDIDKFWQSTWHYLWYGNETYCPPEIHCFCEGYGICFKDDAEYSERLEQDKEVSKLEAVIVKNKETGDKQKDKERNEALEKLRGLREKMRQKFLEAVARGEEKRRPRPTDSEKVLGLELDNTSGAG